MSAPHTLQASIGRCLSAARARRGWSILELSTRSTVHRSTIRRYERGEVVSIVVAILLAKRLGIDLTTAIQADLSAIGRTK